METKITYTLMTPGQPASHHEIKWDGKFASIRDRINAMVDGTLEHVTVLYNGRRADMFVEGDSALNDLPVNEEATKIYHAASLSRDPSADTSSWPKIYGAAVIFDQIVWS